MAAPTEKSIRRRVGERSFARGERYFRNGRLHAARRQGDLLKARCFGSDDNDYRIEVRLNGSKIVSGRCSCPVGADGLCKHVAALLLNWREQPEDFQATPDIEAALADRSRSELIELIQLLLNAEPELEDVLESVLPVGEPGSPATEDEVRQRIEQSLQRLSGGGDPGVAAAAINAQRTQADRRLAAGQTAAALAIGRGILAALIAEYDVNADMTGEVARAGNEAAEFLTRCFEKLTPDDPLRTQILHDLLQLLRFDVCQVGAGLAETVPDAIARTATAVEKRNMAAWAREHAPAAGGGAGNAWQRECWGSLIADLIGDELPDDEYLELCREFDLTAPRVARLLELKRHAAALEAAADVEEPHLPEVAELFVKHGRAGDAIQLMQCRSADSPAAAAWLMDYYEERGEWEDALEWRRHEFEQQPDIVNYRAVRRAAIKVNRWPELQAELLDVAGRIAAPDTRLRILLEEARIGDLLRELETAQAAGQPLDTELLEEIARGCEAAHPKRAIDLYLEVAERLIAGRRQGNYAAASEVLRRARDLSEAAGRRKEWQRRISELATRHSRRRALQQQLRRDKLLT